MKQQRNKKRPENAWKCICESLERQIYPPVTLKHSLVQKRIETPDLVHALLGRWPCYIAGQDQNCFSPLGTKLHFHVNSLWKRSMVLTPNMAALVVANLELQWYITCNTTMSTEFINGNVISVLGIILMVTMPQDEFGLINLYVHCSYNVIEGHGMAPLLLTEMQCGRPFKLPCKKDTSHSPVM